MTALLTDNLPLLAGAPNGIKKLRELILELAVRGKLVPQDPNDEPASELLKRIAEEKARLVAEGKIKKQKSPAESTEGEKPFGLPEGWSWTSLNEIAAMRGGSTPSMSKPEFWDGDIPWVSPKDMHDGEITDSELKITQLALDKTSLELVPIGSILLVGRSGILKRKLPAQITAVLCTINQDLKAISPFQPQPSNYVQLMLRGTERVILREDVKQGTTVQSLVYDKLFVRPFGLPPLAEQHRIVAKVDELMSLCDRLETRQADAESAHAQLVQALLDSLTQARDAEDFAQSWQRLAEHFHTLFTTESSIDALKQTLLQLAVMGKLVPQEHGDEPASEMLKRIQAEKQRLIVEGKVKKQKLLARITEDEEPFELPVGWSWTRLDAITQVITKGSSPKWQGVSYTDNPDDVLFVTSENVGSYRLRLESMKYVEKKFNKIEPRSILERGDFLMNIVGASIGRTAIFDIEANANINQAVCLIRVFSRFLDSQFLLHFFNSDVCLSYMFDKQVDNARANLSMGNIAGFVIPMPPLAEQHRIVAKVDQLMALCDQLKARLNQARQLHEQLASALVEQAVT